MQRSSATRGRAKLADSRPAGAARARGRAAGGRGGDRGAEAGLFNQLGVLLTKARFAEAEPLYRRALAIAEASLGPDHPEVAIRLNNLAALLYATNCHGRPSTYIAVRCRSRKRGLGRTIFIWRRTSTISRCCSKPRTALARPSRSFPPRARDRRGEFGADHPNVARDLNNFGLLLQATDRLGEAEPLFRRAPAIFEESSGPDHPSSGKPQQSRVITGPDESHWRSRGALPPCADDRRNELGAGSSDLRSS